MNDITQDEKIFHQKNTTYSHIIQNTDFQTVSDIFKQLSDSSRLQIYWLLCHCE